MKDANNYSQATDTYTPSYESNSHDDHFYEDNDRAHSRHKDRKRKSHRKSRRREKESFLNER